MIPNSKLFRVFKFVLTGLLLWFLISYFSDKDLRSVGKELIRLPFYVYILLLLFTLLNWMLEAVKWKLLTASMEKMNLFQSFKSVCAGLAASNVMPFRIGEFLGKVIFMKSENRIQASANSIFGGMLQLVVTMLVGLVPAFLLLQDEHPEWMYKAALLGLIPLALIVFVVIYSHKLRHKQKNRLAEIVRNFRNFTPFQLLQLFGVSFLRYAVYACSYYFILHYFGIVRGFSGFAGISTIYFIQSFTPSTVLTDIAVRTTLPMLIFVVPEDMEMKLLSAAILNYSFSVLLPSLFGMCAILAKKAGDFR